MPKRYGRNQKRKHRAEITRLENSCFVSELTISQINDSLKEEREMVREILSLIEHISPNSAALPPKTREGNAKLERINLPICTSVDEHSLNLQYITLYQLETYLTDNREDLSKVVHLKYAGHNK